MLNRRAALTLLTAGLMVTSTAVMAQKQDKKKAKKHVNAGALLGKKGDGKHKLAKAGKVDVEVDVKSGKVANLTAKHPQKGALPVRKVKTREKLASTGPGLVLAAFEPNSFDLAQADSWYYGYWFEEDDYDYYYWFTADEVYVDDSWVVYA